MPNVVFNDIALEEEFNRNGYIKVPFLSDVEIALLINLYFETLNESGGARNSTEVDFENNTNISYDFTFIDRNVTYKKKVFEIITNAFAQKTDNLLNNYRPIIANFIRKQHDGGEVPMHQNWAFVDEEKYTSVSLWVPLVDSNEKNGTLQVVKGSHKRFGKTRGPMIPWELRNLHKEIIGKHLTPMNLNAGECIVLDDSIVHYSNVNQTEELRLAIQLIMVPKEAETIHYHLDRNKSKNIIDVLKTDLNFYMNFHPWLIPTGMKIEKKIIYSEQDFSYQDFISGLNAERFDTNPSNAVSALFIDPIIQSNFEKYGYVKIPLLNSDEVKDLKAYYESIEPEFTGEYGFHISLENKNQAYIDGVFNKLFSVIKPKLNPLLQNYRTFTASYVIKEAGLQNIVPPHQDWTFVDEEKFCSATVWIPIVNVDKNNGALGIIPGSHKLFNYPRQSPSPAAKTILSGHAFTLFPYVEIIEMLAGEALIFNNKTIHASPPNTSDITRIAAGIGITQEEATLIHYFQVPGVNEMINIYKVEDSFFPKYNNSTLTQFYIEGKCPQELDLLKSIRKNTPNISDEEMIILIESLEGVKYNSSLISELNAFYDFKTDGIPKLDQTNHQKNEKKIDTEEVIEPEINTFKASQTEDTRGFFEKYSPANILAEINFRLKKSNDV
jgi:ectoine hydroxylase-related dioxygenase (phytanoyl-CoA dioxygenase family)